MIALLTLVVVESDSGEESFASVQSEFSSPAEKKEPSPAKKLVFDSQQVLVMFDTFQQVCVISITYQQVLVIYSNDRQVLGTLSIRNSLSADVIYLCRKSCLIFTDVCLFDGVKRRKSRLTQQSHFSQIYVYGDDDLSHRNHHGGSTIHRVRLPL